MRLRRCARDLMKPLQTRQRVCAVAKHEQPGAGAGAGGGQQVQQAHAGLVPCLPSTEVEGPAEPAEGAQSAVACEFGRLWSLLGVPGHARLDACIAMQQYNRTTVCMDEHNMLNSEVANERDVNSA